LDSRTGLRERGTGLVFILSAPSGAGKTTLIRKVMAEVSGLRFSVSFTTRPPRAGEVEGKDYHFVSPSFFMEMVRKGEFLEWAEVLGNYYGTKLPDLDRLSAEGKDLILDIDIQGARRVLAQMNHAIAIFVLPPSPEALRERLVGRGLDSPEVIERRLANAKKEIEEAHRYRYVIVNERLEEAAATLKAVIVAERCRRDKESIYAMKMKEWEVDDGKNHG
jgi:guanylate kinase